MDNNEDKDLEEQKIVVSSKTSEEDKKVIENTYNLYTSQTVKIEEADPVIKKKVTGPIINKTTGKLKLDEVPEPEPEVIQVFKSAAPQAPPPVVSQAPKSPQKEITSLNSLNTSLQDKVKIAMSGANADKIKDALKEIETSQDKFFTQEGKIFDNLSKSEVQTVERKISEMKVSNEITEINVSAIISCIDNLKTKKK